MKQIIKYLFYQIFCPVLLFLGVDKFFRSGSLNKRIIVMYHGVTRRKNFSINGRHLPAAEFEKHLIYYKKNFHILSLTEICEREKLSDDQHYIALTFDDGYLNIIEHAIPLLLKYEIPATFFISSLSLVDPTYLHPSDYIDIIRKSGPKCIEINGLSFQNINKQLVSPKYTAYDYINSLDYSEFQETIKRLKKCYPLVNVLAGVDPEVYRLVSSETAKAVTPSEFFTIGSHSHDHVNLEKLTKGELQYQAGFSKKILDECNGLPVNALAFPYGYFNKDVVEISKDAGYKYLFAGGSISEEWRSSVFPRIGILNMAGYYFNMLSINKGFRKFGF